jgi:hypothetical protein
MIFKKLNTEGRKTILKLAGTCCLRRASVFGALRLAIYTPMVNTFKQFAGNEMCLTCIRPFPDRGTRWRNFLSQEFDHPIPDVAGHFDQLPD